MPVIGQYTPSHMCTYIITGITVYFLSSLWRSQEKSLWERNCLAFPWDYGTALDICHNVLAT